MRKGIFILELIEQLGCTKAGISCHSYGILLLFVLFFYKPIIPNGILTSLEVEYV